MSTADYKRTRQRYSASFCNEVYAIVCSIPVGKVATYGSIAAWMGVPGYSRLVGRALKEVPAHLSVPCHRVVNASGRLVPGWATQRALLAAEGISFSASGCVRLGLHLWHPSVE